MLKCPYQPQLEGQVHEAPPNPHPVQQQKPGKRLKKQELGILLPVWRKNMSLDCQAALCKGALEPETGQRRRDMEKQRWASVLKMYKCIKHLCRYSLDPTGNAGHRINMTTRTWHYTQADISTVIKQYQRAACRAQSAHTTKYIHTPCTPWVRHSLHLKQAAFSWKEGFEGLQLMREEFKGTDANLGPWIAVSDEIPPWILVGISWRTQGWERFTLTWRVKRGPWKSTPGPSTERVEQQRSWWLGRWAGRKGTPASKVSQQL